MPVLGVEVSFATNDPAVLAAIETAYGSWAEMLADSPDVMPSDVSVRIVVHETASSDAVEPSVRFRVPDPSRLVMWSGEAVAVADTQLGESVAYVDPGLVGREADFLDSVLGPMTLFQLGALDRRPVHAVAVRRGEVTLALAGPSGVGKSCVAYAATRHGFELVGDEPLYVQTDTARRVWCLTEPLRLPADAAKYFPELAAMDPVTLPTGKRKILVESFVSRPFADRFGLCVLSRGEDDPIRLVPLAPDDAVDGLCAHIDEGYDLYGDTLPARVHALAARGAWRLGLADTPSWAVPALHEAADRLETTP